jgi:CrcB protein
VDRRMTGATALPERPVRILAIAAGGSLGTLARYGLERALGPSALGFPWPTLLANVFGSLLLGLAVTLLVERWPPTRFVRPFVAIGFCGGFTTFSTMAVEATQLGRHGRVGLASLYLIATIGAGLVAGAMGIGLARLGLPVTRRRPIPDPDDVGPLGNDPDLQLEAVREGLNAYRGELHTLGEGGPT